MKFLTAGDSAVVIELGDAIDPELNARVRALDETLLQNPFDGYREAVPTYRSLLVFFDPDRSSRSAIREHVTKLGGKSSMPAPEGRLKSVPVVYDGEDLEEVAKLIGASADEVVALHSGREYLVYMVGFTPGFAYMGMTDARLALGRRPSPRTRVPAGSVAIAMGQTGIYPSDTPGGWHLLGRAEHRTLFSLSEDPPSFFLAGDRVRFVPVDALPEYREPRAPTDHAKAASLTVLDGGLLTTIQDLGRSGYQRYGVPVAGAMDAPALRTANALVGNDAGAAGLECTVSGPTLRCERTLVAAVTGADLGAVLERDDLGKWPVPLGLSFLMRPGNVLRFEGRVSGARAYVAFSGGIDVPVVLGSRATYLVARFGGLEGRALRAGDVIALGEGARRPAPGRRRSAEVARAGESPLRLRVLLGPQDDFFTRRAIETLASATFTVGAASDRMGYRLEGPVLEHKGPKEIISDGMMLGGIQVPPNGLPIVMMADRATTGGYPKIATVVTEDISRLAQLMPGEPLRFEVVRSQFAAKQ